MQHKTQRWDSSPSKRSPCLYLFKTLTSLHGWHVPPAISLPFHFFMQTYLLLSSILIKHHFWLFLVVLFLLGNRSYQSYQSFIYIYIYIKIPLVLTGSYQSFMQSTLIYKQFSSASNFEQAVYPFDQWASTPNKEVTWDIYNNKLHIKTFKKKIKNIYLYLYIYIY